MGLVEWPLASRTPLDMAKELAKTAKENVTLKDRIVALEIEVFWLKVADRNEMEITMEHKLYETADNDRPKEICDRNGEVVLGLCKVCGQAEVELQDTCPGPPPPVDKTCVVTVHNVHGWELDYEMLNKAMSVAAYQLSGAKVIDIYPQERVPADAPAWKNPGWLEWTLRVIYRSGGAITIGVIQREPGAEFESHS